MSATASPASPPISPVFNTSHSETGAQPSTHTTGGHARFFLKQADLPDGLTYSAEPKQDIVEILEEYRTFVKLSSADGCPEHVVDQRAVKFLPRLLRGAAYDSLSQLALGSLEWRTESQLAMLRSNGINPRPVAPSNWSEYCLALSFLFSAPNRISVLAREIATLKQAADQSVDAYALKVTQARTRLILEATRSAPAGTSPHEHAWDVFITAMFENNLTPPVRLECIREDPTISFHEARVRTKKHEANNLRGTPPTTPSAHASAVATHPPPQLRNTVAANAAEIEELRALVATLQNSGQREQNRGQSRGQGNGNTPASHKRSYSGVAKAGAANGTGEKANSAQKPRRQCDYPGCPSPSTHDTSFCNLMKKDAKDGFKRVKG